MDLNAMKLCWQHEARAEAHPPLDRAAVSKSVHSQATDVQRRVRRRLRRELGYYAPTVAALAVTWFTPNRTTMRMALSAVFAAVFAAMLGTLWMHERRMAALPRDGSLREVLQAILESLQAASRAYLIAFVSVYVSGAALVAVLFWWRTGIDYRFATVIVVGTLAVAWSYWSGRAYVGRMFAGYRSTLAECLQELNRFT